ncbi:hypothetical protein MIC97_19580 [Aquamicrobium sp. NLF2-7]|uniref:hypothetical protein n=1 Tax=Aquamicrobium sp. NLF2-7 TaxID=2918753 RepID=UPI001EFA3348|nr:hypothetical protein [Aquamicrobium sp. NLF2-7]MCG8273688.1 hypothetical protein [Aquamicrobium sp. NLF2-7]
MKTGLTRAVRRKPETDGIGLSCTKFVLLLKEVSQIIFLRKLPRQQMCDMVAAGAGSFSDTPASPHFRGAVHETRAEMHPKVTASTSAYARKQQSRKGRRHAVAVGIKAHVSAVSR